MARRVPQLNDSVTVSVTLSPSTEEWAEELLDHLSVETERDDAGLHITHVIGGNCNAVASAALFLRDLEESLSDGKIDPMEFTLKAWTAGQ